VTAAMGAPRQRRRLGLALAFALVLPTLSGCDALRAQKADIFITREATIFLDPPPTETGEAILTIENDDDAEHRPLIIRLDEGTSMAELEVGEDGRLDVGRPIDLEFQGDGYRVVAKLDTMRPYYGQSTRIKTVVHVHLRQGMYAIVDNLPGGIDAGTFAVFEVTA